MKKFMVPLLLGAMAVSVPAWAWTHVSGSITSADPKAHEIVLDNGTTYTLTRSIDMTNLTAGDKVTYELKAREGRKRFSVEFDASGNVLEGKS